MKTVKRSPSSKVKKIPQLKIVPIRKPLAQQDILEQLEKIKELAIAGKINTLLCYYELKDETFHIHVSPSETDINKTGTHLLQMALMRLGFQ